MAEIQGLDADLCRLLARAVGSPYQRYAEWSLEPMAGDRSIKQYLIDEAMKVYTFSKLPDFLQEFLTLCDRSQIIHDEIFGGAPSGLQLEQEDAQVIEEMVRQGLIQEEDGEEEE